MCECQVAHSQNQWDRHGIQRNVFGFKSACQIEEENCSKASWVYEEKTNKQLSHWLEWLMKGWWTNYIHMFVC